MVVFNTPRAGRRNYQYMEMLIKNMWNADHLLYRQGYGVFATDAASIISSFLAIQNTYQKSNHVKAHYMEIFVEKEHDRSDVIRVADCMGRYFFGMGYQAFVTVTEGEHFYLIAIAVNAVSYAENVVFHDNNCNYMNVYRYLCSVAPYDWKVTVSESTFFDPKINDGNYVHGKFA